jgi:hypothetical protein
MTPEPKLFPQEPRGRLIRINRPLLYPAIDPRSPLAVRGAVHARAWQGCCPSSEASIRQFCTALESTYPAVAGDYPGFHDELSDHLRVDGPQTSDGLLEKLTVEFRAYCRLVDRDTPFWRGNGDEFADSLLRIHGRLGGGANSFRSHAVVIHPDGRGNSILFPHHTEVHSLLQRLSAFLRDHSQRHPALCAMTAYAAIIHAHPFADGNGRTARTVYNLLLARETGTRHFVPIHLIASRAQASVLIKLRRALYGGDWTGLQAFFADATRLSHRLQAPVAAAAPDETGNPLASELAGGRIEGAGQNR